MTMPLSDSDILPCCNHTRGRHVELTGAGNGTAATYLCLTSLYCPCSPVKRKRAKRIKTPRPNPWTELK